MVHADDIAKAESSLKQSRIQMELENQLRDFNFAFMDAASAKEIDQSLCVESRNTVDLSPNPKFHGRDDELALLRKELNQIKNDPQFRSMALWGTGGIGKTQLALAYAHECLNNEVPAVFWIDASNSLQIHQGYTKIALTLRLRGAVAQGAMIEGNRNLVQEWLQKTSKH